MLALLSGCGDIYRPVVTSLPPVQPSPQPQKYAVVLTCSDHADVNAPTIDQICAQSVTPGVASLVDFSGDSLTSKVNVGNGPRWLSLSSNGATTYLTNTSGTLNYFINPISQSSAPPEQKDVNTATLLPNAAPTAMVISGNNMYVVQPGRKSIGILTGILQSTPSATLEIPIVDPAAPTVDQYPVNMVGNFSTQRVYAISQGPGGNGCPASGSLGTATGIEVSTNSISSRLPLGACPIYGVMSADTRRVFILNQGSGTVSVIDSQQNQIDPNFPNGIAVGQGPVWADIYNNGSILAVVNSGSNTLTLVNTSLDVYGHDSPNFGKILATVPVGNDPDSVSILQDGTRAYVANKGDGTVSVVNLQNFTVTKTIALPEEPCDPTNPSVLCKVHPMSIAATTGTPLGKVYVVSPDTNILTIIRTDNDTIYANLPLTGTGIQVRVTAP
jgi:YVTN family beta-propeller protein